jgi:hypothetical protein
LGILHKMQNIHWELFYPGTHEKYHSYGHTWFLSNITYQYGSIHSFFCLPLHLPIFEEIFSVIFEIYQSWIGKFAVYFLFGMVPFSGFSYIRK